jgi:hypothetical protein
MDIKEFFQQNVGKWLSQRTTHQLIQNQTENAKSELILEELSANDPVVVQLCQQQGIDPKQAIGSMKTSWSGTVDRNPKQQTGSSVWVLVPDADQPRQGQLLSQIGGKAFSGRYLLGEDDVLTLTTDADTFQAEERIWFASPTFRMRTSVVKQGTGYSVASFSSEIRMGVSAPQPASSN